MSVLKKMIASSVMKFLLMPIYLSHFVTRRMALQYQVICPTCFVIFMSTPLEKLKEPIAIGLSVYLSFNHAYPIANFIRSFPATFQLALSPPK